MKLKKLKLLSIIIFSFMFIYILVSKSYIIYKCSSPSFALNHFATNNSEYNITEILDYNLTFSSDDLLIYNVNAICDNSFSFEEDYTIKLEKSFNTWTLSDIYELN